MHLSIARRLSFHATIAKDILLDAAFIRVCDNCQEFNSFMICFTSAHPTKSAVLDVHLGFGRLKFIYANAQLQAAAVRTMGLISASFTRQPVSAWKAKLYEEMKSLATIVRFNFVGSAPSHMCS